MAAWKTFDVPEPSCSTDLHTWIYSGNWAGHVANQADYSNIDFNFAESQWTQPSVPGNASYTDFHTAPDASFWAGTGITSLVQAGVDSIATSTPTYKFWVEDYPNGTIWEGTPSVSAGDLVYVHTHYLGSSQASFFLENETTGHSVTYTISAPYNGFKAADFINERVHGLYLPNFGTVNTSGNGFGNDTHSYYLSYSANDRWIMTSDCTSSGTLLSEPGSVNADGNNTGDFYHKWYAKSPYANIC